MVRITNPKLNRVAPPAWRPYPGVSLLYDDPVALSGLERLERLAGARHRNDRLYRRLQAVAGGVASAAREEGTAVCLVPRHTYHVTLCDGVNEGTRTQVRQDRRREIGTTLAGLPDSLLGTSSVIRLLRDQGILWSVWTDPVTFRVGGLDVRGHALVARLLPAEGRSLVAKARHEASRSELVARLSAEIGVQVPEWRPHVTLGYFANEDDAARVRDLITVWQDTVRERTGGSSVTFPSASVYGFSDMVSFWRLGH